MVNEMKINDISKATHVKHASHRHQIDEAGADNIYIAELLRLFAALDAATNQFQANKLQRKIADVLGKGKDPDALAADAFAAYSKGLKEQAQPAPAMPSGGWDLPEFPDWLKQKFGLGADKLGPAANVNIPPPANQNMPGAKPPAAQPKVKPSKVLGMLDKLKGKGKVGAGIAAAGAVGSFLYNLFSGSEDEPRQAAGTYTAPYEPKGQAAGTYTAPYEPKGQAAGTYTAPYEPKGQAAGTYTAPYDPTPAVEPQTEPGREGSPRVKPQTEPGREGSPQVQPSVEPAVEPSVEPAVEPAKEPAKAPAAAPDPVFSVDATKLAPQPEPVPQAAPSAAASGATAAPSGSQSAPSVQVPPVIPSGTDKVKGGDDQTKKAAAPTQSAAGYDDLTFKQAFARARQRAELLPDDDPDKYTFKWRGGDYQTNYKGKGTKRRPQEPYIPQSKQKGYMSTAPIANPYENPEQFRKGKKKKKKGVNESDWAKGAMLTMNRLAPAVYKSMVTEHGRLALLSALTEMIDDDLPETITDSHISELYLLRARQHIDADRRRGPVMENATVEDLVRAISHRIMHSGMAAGLVRKHGLDALMDAITDVASLHQGAEEIGSSDVSAMVNSVMRMLGETVDEATIIQFPGGKGPRPPTGGGGGGAIPPGEQPKGPAAKEPPIAPSKRVVNGAAQVKKPGFLSRVMGGLFNYGYAAYAIWDTWSQIEAIPADDPNKVEKITRIVGHLVDQYGVFYVGMVLGGIIGGVFTGGPGSIPGVLAGMAGGLAADLWLGDDVSSIVDSIVDALYGKDEYTRAYESATGFIDSIRDATAAAVKGDKAGAQRALDAAKNARDDSNLPISNGSQAASTSAGKPTPGGFVDNISKAMDASKKGDKQGMAKAIDAAKAVSAVGKANGKEERDLLTSLDETPVMGDIMMLELADGRAIHARIAEMTSSSMVLEIDDTAEQWLEESPDHSALMIGSDGGRISGVGEAWNAMVDDLRHDTASGWAEVFARHADGDPMDMPGRWGRIWRQQHEKLGDSLTRHDQEEWADEVRSELARLNESAQTNGQYMRHRLGHKDPAMLAVWMASQAGARGQGVKKFAQSVAKRSGKPEDAYWSKISRMVSEKTDERHLDDAEDMIAAGFSDEQIMKVTGMSHKQIKKLRSKVMDRPQEYREAAVGYSEPYEVGRKQGMHNIHSNPYSQGSPASQKWSAGHTAAVQGLGEEDAAKASKAVTKFERRIFKDANSASWNWVADAIKTISDVGYRKALLAKLRPIFDEQIPILGRTANVHRLNDASEIIKHFRISPAEWNRMLEPYKRTILSDIEADLKEDPVQAKLRLMSLGNAGLGWIEIARLADHAKKNITAAHGKDTHEYWHVTPQDIMANRAKMVGRATKGQTPGIARDDTPTLSLVKEKIGTMEAGMPSSVAKHKKDLNSKTPEELHARFRSVADRQGGASPERIEKLAREMAWRHGYGKMSDHYWKQFKHLIDDEGMNEGKLDAARTIDRFFGGMAESLVKSVIRRAGILAMQGRHGEAEALLQKAMRDADPSAAKRVADAVRDIKPVNMGGKVADTSALEKSAAHNDWLDNTFIPWVMNGLGLDEAKYHGKEVKLGKPIRTNTSSGGKFKVYVRDPKTGNIKMVRFGDTTGLSIKRDDPKRRKSFRARHHCDNPGPRTKARYWSCRMWTRKPVGKILKGK